MLSATASPMAKLLPELRQDIRLVLAPGLRGEQNWRIYDPVQHRYFQVSRSAFALLSLWKEVTIEDFIAQASIKVGREVSPSEVDELVQFIVRNNLAVEPPPRQPSVTPVSSLRKVRAFVVGVVHNYLFFKVPLVRPEHFLKKTMPYVEPLFSWQAATVVLLISLTGIYLTSRQWDQFVATFIDFLSFEGTIVYGASLIVVKLLHELGHAYTATRYGVRVHTMGVAFMVLTPIAYSDVTDAWRLSDRRQKLAINAAGVATELALAGIALFLWAFLPDGPVRSTIFATATTSIVMTLVVNLNPLMRFDGYHILADWWNMPNLDARSRSVAVWWYRERLFALGDHPPEILHKRRRAALTIFATCVWIYRQSIFIGIALVVYHMFFKALGVVLFLVEVIWFILLPAVGELKAWWNMRERIMASRRSLVTGGAFLLLAALLFIPWKSTIAIQAVMQVERETTIFSPRPARVLATYLTEGRHVEEGALLLTLTSPELTREVEKSNLELAQTNSQLDRIAGDEIDLSSRTVLESERARHEAKLAALKKEIDRLTITAPYSGFLRDVDINLRSGEWIDSATSVARLIAPGQAVVRGYLDEDQTWRLDIGAPASFFPEDVFMSSTNGQVVDIATTGSREIEIPYLASVFGGAVLSDRASEGELRPRSGVHIVKATVSGQHFPHVARGTLKMTGHTESLAAKIWRQVLRVLVRESSA